MMFALWNCWNSHQINLKGHFTVLSSGIMAHTSILTNMIVLYISGSYRSACRTYFGGDTLWCLIKHCHDEHNVLNPPKQIFTQILPFVFRRGKKVAGKIRLMNPNNVYFGVNCRFKNRFWKCKSLCQSQKNATSWQATQRSLGRTECHPFHCRFCIRGSAMLL